MARHGSIGNGRVLALFDQFGYLKDLYYPYAGYENHVVGNTHRVGISVNGVFSWFNNLEVRSEQNSDSFTYKISTKHEDVNITIDSLFYNEKNILIRKVDVENYGSVEKDVKIFFCHEFKINENKYRNTGYYLPEKNVVIHYRGKRAFLINIFSENNGIDDYNIGLFDYEGKEGSYKNAEDINLAKNPVEHGPVDSVVAKNIPLQVNSKKTIYYTMCIGSGVNEVIQLNHFLNIKPAEYLFESTYNYWKSWSRQREVNFYNLSENSINIFYKSLFVIRSHADSRSGGIIASGDTTNYRYGKDNYSYVWARDAYFPAVAFIKLGYFSLAKNLIEFFKDVVSAQGYVLHKFEQDKSLGSSWHPWINDGVLELPIQEDETAAIISLVYEYYKYTKDIEFLEKNYNDLIEICSNFLASFINKKLDLPEPSYDLWESKYMVTTYTTATVINALKNAAEISSILGKEKLEMRYSKAANLLTQGLKNNLYDKKTKSYIKGLYTNDTGEQKYTDHTVDASSFFGLWYYNILDINDKQLKNTYNKTIERLQQNNFYHIRYENDDYFRKDGTIESNPWVITTLWNIQYKIKVSDSKDNLLEIANEIDKVSKLATISGLLPEQVEPHTNKITGYCPLIWSHATFIETVVLYLKKLESMNICSSSLPNPS